MIFVLIIAAIFIVVSVYFYFRSERLQQELVKTRRESSQTRKDNKLLADAMALVAAKQEEFYQFRYKKIQEQAEVKTNSPLADLELVFPLINNYANIFRACLTQKEQLKPVTEKCCESYRQGSYKEFLKFISAQEKHIKRMWGSNNLNGFISLIEALLTEQQKELDQVKTKQSKSA